MKYQTIIKDLKVGFEEAIALGASLIAGGDLVVFPTETVYGLGADAFCEKAVRKIFRAKGRPADNPLIVHIHKPQQLYDLSQDVTREALKLSEAFWPGPLTLVLKKKPCISDLVTASLGSVAIRMPSHPAALALIEASKTCIAAPSANRSGRPSPTTAAHAFYDMQGRVKLILDGGDCSIGLESTVIDVSEGTPTLLRPGGITLEMLQDCIGTVQVSPGVLSPFDGTAPSPGMKYRHYAPKAEVVLVSGPINETARLISSLYDQQSALGRRCAIAATEETAPFYGSRTLRLIGSHANPSTVAHNFFSILRQLDDDGADMIFLEALSPDNMGLAVMNRALRSAGFHVVHTQADHS
ncbi:MAG: L-threonylcarbamoyladenylate synthase [Christensenellales bacterium]